MNRSALATLSMTVMVRIFKRGTIYWVAYNHPGQEGTVLFRTEPAGASGKLAVRERQRRPQASKEAHRRSRQDQFIGPSDERLSFEDIADALVTDYEINNLRSLRPVMLSLKHLRRTFALERAVDITTDKIKKYIASRQREGAANECSNSP